MKKVKVTEILIMLVCSVKGSSTNGNLDTPPFSYENQCFHSDCDNFGSSRTSSISTMDKEQLENFVRYMDKLLPESQNDNLSSKEPYNDNENIFACYGIIRSNSFENTPLDLTKNENVYRNYLDLPTESITSSEPDVGENKNDNHTDYRYDMLQYNAVNLSGKEENSNQYNPLNLSIKKDETDSGN